jgi:alkylation response protein AidB-like acyl-CoA dehydrogenase
MDFELSDEQKDIQKAAMEFAQGEFDPDIALELDQSRRFPESIWKKASQLGFIGLHYPEEFGGQGLGLFENILVIETFCRVDSGIGSALSSVDLGSEVILKFGSYEQKKNLLSSLAKGERRLSIAFAESEDERDFTSISTIAEKRGEEYFIQGKKRFIRNGPLADIFIVLCKEPVEQWITLLVEREKDGIEVLPIEKMGLRMVPFSDFNFNGVRISHMNRVGSDGDGMIQVKYCYQAMGVRSMAQALGVAQGGFDRAIQYAKQREQFSRKLSQFQVIQHKLADMAVSIEVSRWLTYKSAIEFDQERLDSGFISIAQLEVGRRLIGVVDEALQIFGGYGYMVEQAIEHYFRDAWAIVLELGTEEELKDSIAERLLGLESMKNKK